MRSRRLDASGSLSDRVKMRTDLGGPASGSCACVRRLRREPETSVHRVRRAQSIGRLVAKATAVAFHILHYLVTESQTQRAGYLVAQSQNRGYIESRKQKLRDRLGDRGEVRPTEFARRTADIARELAVIVLPIRSMVIALLTPLALPRVQ